MAGKKYAAALSQVDRSKTYDYKEAITLAKKISSTKFDSSMEVSFFLNVDPRQADQNIRGAILMVQVRARRFLLSHRVLRKKKLRMLVLTMLAVLTCLKRSRVDGSTSILS